MPILADQTPALSEVRERFRRTFDDGPLGIALVGLDDSDGRILEANSRLAEILGRPAVELVGHRVAEFTHYEDAEDQARAIGALAGGTIDRYSSGRRLIHADGHVVWCTITGSAVRDDAGRLLYGVALVDDVTDRKLKEEALREAHLALDHAVLGIAFMGISGCCRTVNAYYAASLGYEPNELVGKPWGALVHADDHDAMRGAIDEVLLGHQATTEVRGLRKDGSTFFEEVVLVANTSSDGTSNGYFHFMRDVTDRHHVQRALADSEARYRRIIQTANDGVWTVDAEGRTTFLNGRMATMLGCEQADVLGRSFLDFLHESERDRALVAFRERNVGEPTANDFRFVRSDGTDAWFLMSVSPFIDEGEVSGALAMVSDVTERKRTETEMTRLALRDELTGLPNRALLEKRLRGATRQARTTDTTLAVLSVDLDRFKTINDGFGHEAGDELLRIITPRLQAVTPSGGTLARFGGDEFVMLCKDLRDEEQACAIADRVLAAIETPISLSVGDVTITASVGIAAGRGAAAEDLLRDSDTAMYRAKDGGGGRREVFDVSMREAVLNALNLERDLRHALADGQLYLDYQPIVALADETPHGLEALLRWRHPERGSVSPAEFIPLAERTGLIVPIGRWVLREACQQIGRWTATADAPWAHVAVNVSARQVDHPGFVEDLRQILQTTGIEPHRLELEITETALFSRDAAATTATFRSLQELGIGVVLDDFGTGYSSLSYLARFPLTGLKLDRSFLRDVETEHDKRSIVEAIVAMAQSLGLSLVGEGVETVEQASLLSALGCDLAQGYLFAHPMPPEQIARWVATYKRHTINCVASPATQTDAWVSMGEATLALGVSASTLRRWAAEGRIGVHRTSGGHRRFAISDIKRLSLGASRPRVNLPRPAPKPLPRLAGVLDTDGARLAEIVVAGLYEKPTSGWFRAERARRPLRQWIRALSLTCRGGGAPDEVADATSRVVRQAEIGGASLLECTIFVERFTVAVFATFLRTPDVRASEQRDVKRLLASVRHGVLAGH